MMKIFLYVLILCISCIIPGKSQNSNCSGGSPFYYMRFNVPGKMSIVEMDGEIFGKFVLYKPHFSLNIDLGQKVVFKNSDGSSQIQLFFTSNFTKDKKSGDITNFIKLSPEDLKWIIQNRMRYIEMIIIDWTFKLSMPDPNGIQNVAKCFLKQIETSTKQKITSPTLAPFKSKDNNLYGYTNKMGDVVIPYSYLFASRFKEGKALVCHQRDGLYWINEKAEKIKSYNHSSDFSNVHHSCKIGSNAFFRFMVKNGYKEYNYYFNKEGKLLHDINALISDRGFYKNHEYSGGEIISVGSSSYSNSIVTDKKGQVLFGLMKGKLPFFSRNYDNHLRHDPKRGKSTSYCIIFHAIGSIDGSRKTGVVDAYGSMVLHPVYKMANYNVDLGCVHLKKRGEQDIIFFLNTGKKIFSDKFLLCKDYIIYKEGEKFGYMDASNGKTIITPQFDYADCFDEKLKAAFVKKNNREFYIDKKGNFAGTVDEMKSN